MPATPLRRLLIDKQSSVRHLYQRQVLAVSHCWQEADAPDKEGGQLRTILSYVLLHPEVRYVWFDYCACSREPNPVPPPHSHYYYGPS